MNKKQTFELIKKLWEEAGNDTVGIKKFQDYWKGKPTFLPDGDDSGKSAFNIIFQIVEAKLSALLDSNITLNVINQISSFQDLTSMKEMQAVADVYQDKLKQVLDDNHLNAIKERLARQGLIASISPIQTYFNDDYGIKGRIEIKVLDASKLRWDKTATGIHNATFIGYEDDVNPAELKNRYAKNPDGSWNEELIDEIDTLAKTTKTQDKGKRGGIISYQSDQGAGQQYAYKGGLESAGKTLKVVCLYLLDDSLYTPQEGDSTEKEVAKEEARLQYPNGRYIIFIPDSKTYTILKDDALPESFKNIGNIDIFKPYDIDSFTGLSEADQLIPVQDRMNAAFYKIRQLVAKYVSIILLDKGLDIDVAENDLINQFVAFMDNVGRGEGKLPPILENNTLTHLNTMKEYIEFLKQQAYSIARVNETFINGLRQEGTTSANQVDALQESPMASIRLVQRNMVDTLINVGEKILTLIQAHCNTQELITLSTRMMVDVAGQQKEATHAMIGSQTDEQGQESQTVSLYDEAGKAVKTIKVDPNWKFQVKVIAGTEIPRTRRENAQTMTSLFNEGVFGDPTDLDIKEQYLRSLDIPNYREFISIARKKQSEMEETNKTTPKYMQILTDPNQSKAASDFLKALEYNSQAKSEFLGQLGFQNQTVDKMTDAPAQTVVSKSDIATTATAVPEIISNDPQLAKESQAVTAQVLDKEFQP